MTDRTAIHGDHTELRRMAVTDADAPTYRPTIFPLCSFLYFVFLSSGVTKNVNGRGLPLLASFLLFSPFSLAFLLYPPFLSFPFFSLPFLPVVSSTFPLPSLLIFLFLPSLLLEKGPLIPATRSARKML